MTGFDGNVPAALTLDAQFGIALDHASAARVFAHWAADGRILEDAVRATGPDTFFDIAARRFDAIVAV